MGLNTFQVALSDLAILNTIRADPSFYDPDSVSNKLLTNLGKSQKSVRLRAIVKSITQGESVRIIDGEPSGEIGIITIENIDVNSININPSSSFVPSSSLSESSLLTKGDLITPRVRRIGAVNKITTSKTLVPSENVLVIKLDSSALQRYDLYADFVAFYLSYLGSGELIKLRTGGQSGSINHLLVREAHIPLLTTTIQKRFIERAETCELRIQEIKKSIIPLQQIIDKSFADNGIKDEGSSQFIQIKPFVTDLSSFDNGESLRCGSRYRWFWDVNKGNLFDSQFPLVPLGSLIEHKKQRIVSEGRLPRESQIVELDDVQVGTGRILVERFVDEVASSKIYLGDSDLATTRLRPYLGYTILIKHSREITEQEATPLIGTSEFIPFKVRKDKALPRFIQYLLLTNDYLLKSKFLMFGKEHPRIQRQDLFATKVPDVPMDVQKHVIGEVKSLEEKNNALFDEILHLRENTTRMIMSEAGLDFQS